MNISGYVNQYSSISLMPAHQNTAQAQSQASEIPQTAGAGRESEQADAQNSTTSREAAYDPAAKLTEQEQLELDNLKKQDQEVHAHEQAHMAALGGYAKGGAKYQYTTGPDAHRYATGGEVPVDMSKVPDNPSATIAKARTIAQAALAPADPSAADRSVHAAARKMEQAAQKELSEKQQEELQDLVTAGAGMKASLLNSTQDANDQQNDDAPQAESSISSAYAPSAGTATLETNAMLNLMV